MTRVLIWGVVVLAAMTVGSVSAQAAEVTASQPQIIAAHHVKGAKHTKHKHGHGKHHKRRQA